MKRIPSGTELARPFLPAKDFDLSKSFYEYESLGFQKLLDADVAIFNTGTGGFVLQRHYQKDWAENFMMQLMVEDLDGWWAHIDKLDLPARFHVPSPRAPAMQPVSASPMSWIPPECSGILPNGDPLQSRTSGVGA